MQRVEDNQPGRMYHPKGGYTPGMFSGVASVDEFANALGVPKEAIEYVLPTKQKCRSNNCSFNAIQGNHGH